jgi:hypothetical protein
MGFAQRGIIGPLFLLVLSFAPGVASAQDRTCRADNTVVADVVALDMPMVFNRLGAQNVNWQMFALQHDLVRNASGRGPRPLTAAEWTAPSKLVGKVTLRPDLRPRPLVLRVAAGECLQVNFTNLLTKVSNPHEAHKTLLPTDHPMDQRSRDPNMDIDDQVASRLAGFHPSGLELVGTIGSDASYAGKNIGTLALPGQRRQYTFFAPQEGSFLVTNPGAAFGGEGTAGTSGTGLFGAVAVQPAKGRAYRGQVTEEELRLATRRLGDPALAGQPVQACAVDPALACTASGHPVIDYEALYPATAPWTDERKAGLPILNMTQTQNGVRRLVHGDINAIVLGPQKDGGFPRSTYPLESTGVTNPTLPNRLEPFREFVSVYHDENAAAQAFPGLFDHPVLGHTLHGVRDAFMINYGSAGVGAEVIANRLRVGPMHDCVDCAFEEFFLSSFTVGDPALLVDKPANAGLETIAPLNNLPGPDLVGVPDELVAELMTKDAERPLGEKVFGPKASKVFYPHDPANVHHSYIGDFVKFRNLHTGKEQHIFHLHNHQWLFNPNDDNSNYIDAQAIGPGSGYTYEIAFGGSGNRNKSAGDAVFHCHYYPHFAQGMWYLWRIHDTFEAGTQLAVSQGKNAFHEKPFALSDGTPAKGSRALPDGELVSGTPIPAVVPLPGKGLAVMPGQVEVVANPRQLPDGRPVGSLAKVVDRKRNPGFPFWIAGIEDTVGSRPPTPPLDMDPSVGGFDGGLPRHTVEGYSAGSVAHGKFTRLNAEKKEDKVKPRYFPERGTDMEQVAMKFHEASAHDTTQFFPSGAVQTSTFATNGAKRTPGAPFFDPCIDDRRRPLTAANKAQFFGANGLASLGGSPFNADTPRIYKGANIQLNVTFNKLGDHYPQQRILALWEDVDATLLTSFKPIAKSETRARAPEPMVLRMNTFDCARYLHTNLVPKDFEMDDYQVKTPTDIIGQHIHLPKWDLPSADGSANGWNYEDGTFSPGMVRNRIYAINKWNDSAGAAAVPNPYAPGQVAFDPSASAVALNADLKPRAHYFFGRGGPFQRDKNECESLWDTKRFKAFHNLDESGLARPGVCDWLGARTTIQRWFSDPIINKEHQHRGLGITFTHDHLGPSTHQQVGLYATMLTEPPDSTWVHNESGELLYSRDVAGTDCSKEFTDGSPTTGRCDGGPTTWQAVIRTANEKEHESHREFFLQFGDFQHAYRKGEFRGVNELGIVVKADEQSFRKAITPSFRQPAKPNWPDVVALDPRCPGGNEKIFSKQMRNGSVVEVETGNTPAHIPRPCPELISADDIGTMVVNYRQEPLAARVFNPATKRQSSDGAGDMAFAFQTRTDREIKELNGVGGENPSVPGSLPAYHEVDGSGAPLLDRLGQPIPVDVNQLRRLGDPFTPILRAYSGDLVRIKIQAGSHEHEHSTAINGLKWLQAGSGYGQAPHSGWRGGQNIGLSEQFTLAMRITDQFEDGIAGATDRLYAVDTSQDGLWNGVWGVVRTLQRRHPGPDRQPMLRDDQDQLALLPNLKNPREEPRPVVMSQDACPKDARVRHYHLVAGLANKLLPPAANVTLPPSRGLDPKGGSLVYNPRLTEVTLNVFHEADDPSTVANEEGTVKETRRFGFGPLHDPTAILVVRKSDIDPVTRQIKPTAPVEPIVLRAAAGECVQVVMENWLPTVAQGPMPELPGFTTLGMLMTRNEGSGTSQFTSFNNNHIRASRYMGLHPQMLLYDTQLMDGNVVGVNRESVVAPGDTILYNWYAGGLQYGDVPASANVCELSPDRAQGFRDLNDLRNHLRNTPDGVRRLRPLNHLFTPDVLLARLQRLLSPPLSDERLPASVDGRLTTGGFLVPTRPLVLSASTLALLQRAQPGFASRALLATVAPPPGVSATQFDGLLTRALTTLLANDNVARCLEAPVRGEPVASTLPPEAQRALSSNLPTFARSAANGVDSAPLYAPDSAFSATEALRRREACSNDLREPINGVLKAVFANSFLPAEKQVEVSNGLASSVAFLTPGIDPDALGGKGFDEAFKWYNSRTDAVALSDKTSRLVAVDRDGICRFEGIEFGGTNLTPPDRIKQGQKAAVGAMVIEPEKSFWWETIDDTALDRQNPGPAPGAVRASRATAHVIYPATFTGDQPGDWRYFRDLVAVSQKGLNMRYGKYPSNGHFGAVGSLAAERESAEKPPLDRLAPEDAHDAGQMAINYGSEPMWFRFGLDPSAPFGHGPSVSNPLSRGEGMGALKYAYQGFSNRCCLTNSTQPSTSTSAPLGEPYTPIFKVAPFAETRLRQLLPTGAGRGTTMVLHGHGWQRDPYLAQHTTPLPPFGALHRPATTPAQYGTASKCQGKNASGMYLGAQDSVAPMAHFDWLLPSAGGQGGIQGDHLMRDIGGFGVTSGLWALMRVEGTAIPLAMRKGPRTECH